MAPRPAGASAGVKAASGIVRAGRRQLGLDDGLHDRGFWSGRAVFVDTARRWRGMSTSGKGLNSGFERHVRQSATRTPSFPLIATAISFCAIYFQHNKTECLYHATYISVLDYRAVLTAITLWLKISINWNRGKKGQWIFARLKNISFFQGI